MPSLSELRAYCARRYPDYLRSLMTEEPFFPLTIRCRLPKSTDPLDRVQEELRQVKDGEQHFNVDWEECNSRRHARQRFPQRIWMENEEQFLKFIGKTAEAQGFRRNLLLTREQCPGLLPWVEKHPSQLAEAGPLWADLLKVCVYFTLNPRPGLYGRQLPVAVDTKFLERHQGILTSLLDHLLPAEAKTGSKRFEERFGLRYDEHLVRLRLLDPDLHHRLNIPFDDLALPLSSLCRLSLSASTVLIVENKMVFLAMDPLPQTLLIWGSGRAAELLTSVPWLAGCRLLYWGDIDTHGFHILSRLRTAFPHLEGLLMDETTLDTHTPYWVPAKKAAYEEISGLNENEQQAYRRVLTSQISLEQEKIAHRHAMETIRSVLTYQT